MTGKTVFLHGNIERVDRNDFQQQTKYVHSLSLFSSSYIQEPEFYHNFIIVLLSYYSPSTLLIFLWYSPTTFLLATEIQGDHFELSQKLLMITFKEFVRLQYFILSMCFVHLIIIHQLPQMHHKIFIILVRFLSLIFEYL